MCERFFLIQKRNQRVTEMFAKNGAVLRLLRHDSVSFLLTSSQHLTRHCTSFTVRVKELAKDPTFLAVRLTPRG